MMMTFQELNDQIGAEAIYTGTNVDLATQAVILDWCGERYLSMEPNENVSKWLTRYRRNLNSKYPIYMDYLRIESVRSNFDPFITDFMERVHEDKGSSSETGFNSRSGTESKTDGETTTTDNTQTRTPDLTTSSVSNGTSQTTGTSQNINQLVGQVIDHRDEEATDEGKARSISIAYPEANMGGIPTDIDSFPSDIDYASGEGDNLTKNTHEGNSDSTSSTNNTTTDSGSQNGTGSEHSDGTVHETGNEVTDFDGRVVKQRTESDSSQETGSTSSSSTDQREVNETEQGRHESPADLLPRAIEAITKTNAIEWFINRMQICFDNYDTV